MKKVPEDSKAKEICEKGLNIGLIISTWYPLPLGTDFTFLIGRQVDR